MDIRLSANLCFLRQKFGYSLEEVAERMEVSRQAVSKWESGESLPDLPNTVKMATLFRVPLDQLVLDARQDGQKTQPQKHAMGIMEISDKGQIDLPEEVRKLLDIQPGEKLLLLADKNQGIAIVKCNQFDKEPTERPQD